MKVCLAKTHILMNPTTLKNLPRKGLVSCALFCVFALCVLATARPMPAGKRSRNSGEAGSQQLYSHHCAACHGSDGRARTSKGKRLGATDFTSTGWNTDDARALRIITNGKGEMPSFKKKLTVAEMRSVWNYALAFRR